MKLPTHLVCLAMSCINKSSKRDYLNNICIHKKGHITATDGNIMFISAHIPQIDVEENVYVRLAKKPSTSCEYIVLGDNACTGYDKNDNVKDMVPLEYVEGKDLDFKKFYDLHEPDTATSFDPNILKILSGLNSKTVNVKLGAAGTPSIINCLEGCFLIMPQTHTEIDVPALLS